MTMGREAFVIVLTEEEVDCLTYLVREDLTVHAGDACETLATLKRLRSKLTAVLEELSADGSQAEVA